MRQSACLAFVLCLFAGPLSAQTFYPEPVAGDTTITVMTPSWASIGDTIVLVSTDPTVPCDPTKSTAVPIDGSAVVSAGGSTPLKLKNPLTDRISLCAFISHQPGTTRSISTSPAPSPPQVLVTSNLPSSQCARSASSNDKNIPDYTLGCPRIWTYQRVYPFLDGVFQDLSTTQLQALMVSSNGPNASNLNAVQTTAQVGVAYSSVSATQNQLSQQQAAAAAANNAVQTQLQNQLITQETTLAQQLTTANQQAAQDNATYQQLVQNPNATSVQLAAAQGVVTNDNAVVSNLNTELSNLKAQLVTTSSISSPTFTSPTPPTPSGSSLPTSFSAPPGAPSTPAFPASKQMDNQYNLLWERMSRLVSTLAQADSLSKYKLVLTSFNVDLLPMRRKKELFAAEYSVKALGGNSSCDADGARVIDLFPSASATNIVSTKYTDTRWGLSGLLSWFSAGLTAQLIREHLQLSQSLGQSAYLVRARYLWRRAVRLSRSRVLFVDGMSGGVNLKISNRHFAHVHNSCCGVIEDFICTNGGNVLSIGG